MPYINLNKADKEMNNETIKKPDKAENRNLWVPMVFRLPEPLAELIIAIASEDESIDIVLLALVLEGIFH